MAKPLPKGQKRGADYVRAELKRRANVSQTIESQQFGASTAEEGDVVLTYDPTNTSWPGNGHHHRRTTAAGYNSATGILRVEFFTDGALYDYGVNKPVPAEVAMAFRRTNSPGVFINRYLESYGYERVR